MAKAKMNMVNKALQAMMAREKKWDAQAEIEWLIACNTNKDRGKVYNQSEINALYGRDNKEWDSNKEQGATKTCHLECHNGNDFKYIVVKRHQTDGYIDEHAYDPDSPLTGNQLVDEINCWQEWADKPEADYLCPILKFFTSKSDKVTATSETMQRNVVIIAQRAVYVDSLKFACYDAADRNGYDDDWAEARFEEMKHFSKRMGWRDAIHNPGNSGVIYDYSTGEYKAVFIDYAL